MPYVSPFTRDYLKRDFEDDSFKPRKCRPYCRCYACRMAYRKAMEDQEEIDKINEGTNIQDTDHTDQTNESSSPFKAFSPIDDSIPEIGHEPSHKEQTK